MRTKTPVVSLDLEPIKNSKSHRQRFLLSITTASNPAELNTVGMRWYLFFHLQASSDNRHESGGIKTDAAVIAVATPKSHLQMIKGGIGT